MVHNFNTGQCKIGYNSTVSILPWILNKVHSYLKEENIIYSIYIMLNLNASMRLIENKSKAFNVLFYAIV